MSKYTDRFELDSPSIGISPLTRNFPQGYANGINSSTRTTTCGDKTVTSAPFSDQKAHVTSQNGYKAIDHKAWINRGMDLTLGYTRISTNWNIIRGDLIFINQDPNFYCWLGQKYIPGTQTYTLKNVLYPGIPTESDFTNLMASASSLATEAKSKALKSFNSEVLQRSTSALNVSAMEWRSTMDMIRSPLKMLTKSLIGFARQTVNYFRREARKTPRKERADRFTSIVANSYLEKKFGWDNLISDAELGAQTLAELVSGSLSSRQEITKRAYVSGVYRRYVDGSDGFCTYRKIHVFEYGYSALYGAEILLDYLNSVDKARHMTGFTFANFVPTVWEIIPFSFVVDYFTNIGDILNSTNVLAANLRFPYYVTKRTVNAHFTAVHTGNIGYWRNTGGSFGTVDAIRTEHIRQKLTSLALIPPFELSLPNFGQATILGALAIVLGESKRETNNLLSKG